MYRAYPLKTFKKTSGVVNDVVGVPGLAIMYEADTETFSAKLSNAKAGATALTIADDTATGTIRDDDATPTLK